jgi:hypothetical protein
MCCEEGNLPELLLCLCKPQRGATHTKPRYSPTGAQRLAGTCVPADCLRRGKGVPSGRARSAGPQPTRAQRGGQLCRPIPSPARGPGARHMGGGCQRESGCEREFEALTGGQREIEGPTPAPGREGGGAAERARGRGRRRGRWSGDRPRLEVFGTAVRRPPRAKQVGLKRKSQQRHERRNAARSSPQATRRWCLGGGGEAAAQCGPTYAMPRERLPPSPGASPFWQATRARRGRRGAARTARTEGREGCCFGPRRRVAGSPARC